MQKIHVAIEGMSCGHCVARVRKALEAIEGARVVTVEVGSADIEIDSAGTAPEDVARAVTDIGFPARASAARAA